MTPRLNTVCGSIPIDALGKTLMHEHLVIGLPGWEGDSRATARTRREVVARCVDLVQELQAAGISSLLDPCPNDIGRDPDVMGEVASRTGFNILFATGLYEDALAGAYWKAKVARDPDAERYLTEMYIEEIERGVGTEARRPAVIKVATGKAPFTSFELVVLRAAAAAAAATGTPITTHTHGCDGEKQLQILVEGGARPEKIIIGHCCGSSDRHYHRELCERGTYVGFDRFGLEQFNSDDSRVECLVDLLGRGYGQSVIVSHDCVFNMRGNLNGAQDPPPTIGPMHFLRTIAPRLRALGVAAAAIDALLTDNPRRYFEGGAPARAAPDGCK